MSDMPEEMPDSATDRPLVTLALFSFNQEEYIVDALSSALCQTYRPLEILCFDDCSSDETVTRIEGLLSAYSGQHRVELHRNEANLGWDSWGQHINNAVIRASGDLIILAAGDDISVPERVTRLVATWVGQGKPSGIVHSAFDTLSEDPKLSGRLRQDGEAFGNFSLLDVVRNDGEGILGATLAFTRDLFTRFGPLTPGTVFEDRVLGFRALLAGKVLYLPEPLVRYRIHDGNVSGPNIYANAARWDRFCRGHRTLFAAFRHDYQQMHPDAARDPQILCEIGARLGNVARTERLVTGTTLERLMAAYHVSSKQENWRYRVSFILKYSGLDQRRPVFLLRNLVRRRSMRQVGKHDQS
jgi:glycosyltransferase involved in cell wall biosynthesis